MKKYAKIENNLIKNIDIFPNDHALPDGWIDVTDIPSGKGDPLIDGVPEQRLSIWHTVIDDNSGWEITPENQALKDNTEDEQLRLSDIHDEQATSGIKKITLSQANNKIDQIYSSAVDFDTLKAANILFAKKIIPFIINGG